MLVLRRVRRRLLLPPGWVALGFLLLLGCQALRPWVGQVRLWNVIQITMPALRPDKWNRIPQQSPWQLNRLRTWHTIEFRGRKSSDSLSAVVIESATQKIIADYRHAGGVRVRFLPGATYANLIRVLDIMNYAGQKKYWLDIHHQPITLYAITEKSLAIAPPKCLPCDDAIRSPSTPAAQVFQQLLTEFWQRIESLKERVWRQSLLLLLVISSLSLWRLLPKEPSRFNY